MKLQQLSVLFFIFSATANANPSIGDSTAAMATQTIVQRLQIKKISDLNFGEASPGDGPKTILAGGVETRENASFEVQGEPLRAFQVILPAPNSVKMINGPGGANREIVIQDFNSTPAGGGLLDQAGKTTVFVGATRQAIPANQKVGDYAGQFYVTVVY